MIKYLAAMPLLLSFAAAAWAQPPLAPEITMSFSSDSILLGEPVWVLLTARNTSSIPLRWNPGDYCHMRSTRPITAVVPDAAPGDGRAKACTYGASAGSCMTGGNTTVLAAGASATWRYLLEGEFHFTRPGSYRVIVTSHPAKPFVSRSNTSSIADAKVDSTTQTLRLVVLPRDDVALLAREKKLAEELELPIRSEGRPTGVDQREYEQRASANLHQIRRGLVAQPLPGVEEVFSRWLLTNAFEAEAIEGLRNLNTPQARAKLATLANTPSARNSYTQDAAINALGEIGDQQFLSLLLAQISSRNSRVHRAAIFATGKVGGDAAVPKLVELLRGPNAADRNDAATALGVTTSRAAVKSLIDAIAASDELHSSVHWPLFVLTHHVLPNRSTLRTAAETHSEWLRWWNDGGKDARIYSRFECAPPGAFNR